MTNTPFTKEANLFDFFHERVEDAVHKQSATVSEEGVYYITNLLVENGHPDETPSDDTLVGLRIQAQNADRRTAIRSYRQLGDKALVQTGFFRDSIRASILSIEYYLHMGASAYATLSKMLDYPTHRALGGHKNLSEIFRELARHFEACSNVLQEVEQEVRSESEVHSDLEVLRLYERWLVTGSRSAADRLRSFGILPVAAPDETC